MIIKFADFEIYGRHLSYKNESDKDIGWKLFSSDFWALEFWTRSMTNYEIDFFGLQFSWSGIFGGISSYYIERTLWILNFHHDSRYKNLSRSHGTTLKKTEICIFAMFKRWLWRFSTILKTFDTWQMITNRNTSKPQIMEVSKSGRGQLIRFIIPNNCKISTFQIVIKHGYNTSAHKFNNK